MEFESVRPLAYPLPLDPKFILCRLFSLSLSLPDEEVIRESQPPPPLGSLSLDWIELESALPARFEGVRPRLMDLSAEGERPLTALALETEDGVGVPLAIPLTLPLVLREVPVVDRVMALPGKDPVVGVEVGISTRGLEGETRAGVVADGG